MMLGVTMGDSNGVGPEILVKTFAGGDLRHPFVAFGDIAVMWRCAESVHLKFPLRCVQSPGDYRDGFLNIVDLGMLKAEDVRPGEISAKSGAAARAYVAAATEAALKHEIAAVVTLPMSKEATQLSDRDFVGHTELIASLCGVRDVTMMLASERLIVTHVSTHCALRTAIERVKRDRVLRVIELTWQALQRLKPEPRIAVAGLNPHAGEHGLFGREESEEIEPAVHAARARGISVEGPFPPDTVFYLAVNRKRFDAVVCMYHDQGHIPAKLLDFETGVNVTLGLPIIRTSVDHGTAFDIAYKGVASTRSFVAATEFAARLAGSGS